MTYTRFKAGWCIYHAVILMSTLKIVTKKNNTLDLKIELW